MLKMLIYTDTLLREKRHGDIFLQEVLSRIVENQRVFLVRSPLMIAVCALEFQQHFPLNADSIKARH